MKALIGCIPREFLVALWSRYPSYIIPHEANSEPTRVYPGETTLIGLIGAEFEDHAAPHDLLHICAYDGIASLRPNTFDIAHEINRQTYRDLHVCWWLFEFLSLVSPFPV